MPEELRQIQYVLRGLMPLFARHSGGDNILPGGNWNAIADFK